ncbi:MAG: redox-sensing transcriptional repressor Rex, partial [Gorillibacterium sp.]|nr:redox-sensing transcriptional repressor Rex [Gorillibacterium sp.]
VGAGNLGKALSNYNVYLDDNMRIVALFDASPAIIGTTINNLKVHPINDMPTKLRQMNVRVGIITVPNAEAQKVADDLVAAGVEAILNFAPSIIRVPANIRVHYADFTTDLQSLAYYLE